MKKPLRLFALVLAVLLLSAMGCAKDKASDKQNGAFRDGVYEISVSLSGGTGRATVLSPAKLTIQDGAMTARIVWSSSNYDYMVVDGKKILSLTLDGGSTFEIPVAALDTEIPVIGDTTAMSVPHEVEYTLHFDSSAMTEVSGGAE